MLVSPDELTAAAHRLDVIQSDLGSMNLAAAASTTGIAAAAHDEISQSLASLFSTYGQQLHAAIEQTGVFGTHQFAAGLTSAASNYASTEASIITSLISQIETQIEAAVINLGATALLAIIYPIVISAVLAYLIFLIANRVVSDLSGGRY
jgi:hypothetical protein